MLILFIILCIIFIVLAIVGDNIEYCDYKSIKNWWRIILREGSAVFSIIGIGCGTFAILIGFVVLLAYTPNIDKKIAMYQEENQKIEQSIDTLIESYMAYEKDLIFEVKSDSSIQLISLYPELSADELVKAQIDTYVSNNQKIKRLKECTINQEYIEWWIHF